MRIGLIDVDGIYNDKHSKKKYPNFALMKISAYHKSKGDIVEWVGVGEYDIIYKSKIFTFTPDVYFPMSSCKRLMKGGTGYDISSRLPDEIESMDPDYSIYPKCDFSIQFFSRGCIRNCPFCLVRHKEGKIQPCETKELNPNGKMIDVFDNNFFANPLWRDAVEFLNSTKQPVNLHGVDVRIMNEEQAYALNSMRLKGSSIHIAWDNPKDDILPNLRDMLKQVKRYKVACYVLIGYWSTPEEDDYRVKKLVELGVDPFVQPYRDYNNERIPTQYEKDFASWANKKERLKSFPFADFSPRKGFKCSAYFQ